MSALYYATSQKPSAVTHAAVGCLTAPGTLTLVLGLTSRLELYSVSGGLAVVASVPLHGRIAALRLVRPSALAPDAPGLLLLVTERSQFMVLRWDAAAQGLVTEAAGDLRVRGLAIGLWPSVLLNYSAPPACAASHPLSHFPSAPAPPCAPQFPGAGCRTAWRAPWRCRRAPLTPTGAARWCTATRAW